MATPKLKLGNDKWATKQRSLLAFNDEGNNFKSLPFQVERLSGGSYKGRNGLIQYAATEEPRIDFTNYSKGALLLEPQRTNLKTNSEAVNNWTQSNISTSTNQTTAPDGTNNADKIIENSGSGSHKVYEGVSTTSGQVYTWSVFLKSDTRSKVRLNIFGAYAEFDVTNQTLLTQSGITSYKIEDYGNGWGRFSITETANASSTLTYVYLLNDSGSVSYTGDGSSGLFVWGGQLEQGSYSTSYTPTADSTATRIADLTENDSIPGDLINSTEGTLFIDFEYLYETTTDSSTDANRDYFVLGTSADLSEGVSFDNYRSQFRVFIYQSSGNIFIGNSGAGAAQPNTRYKLAVKYKTGDCKAYLNGSLLGSSTGTVSFATDLNGIFFSYNSGSRPYKNQKRVYDLQYFNTALTDAELQTLTTL